MSRVDNPRADHSAAAGSLHRKTATKAAQRTLRFYEITACEAGKGSPRPLARRARMRLPGGWTSTTYGAERGIDRCGTPWALLRLGKDTRACHAVATFAQAWNNRRTRWSVRRFLRAAGVSQLAGALSSHGLQGAWGAARDKIGARVIAAFLSRDRREICFVVLFPTNSGCSLHTDPRGLMYARRTIKTTTAG